MIKDSNKLPVNTDPTRHTQSIENLLSVDEVAARLRLSCVYIYKLTSAKKIPFYKVGSRTLFDWRAIEKWLETKKKEN